MKLLLPIILGLLLTVQSAYAQKTFKKVPASEIAQQPSKVLPSEKTFFDNTLDRFESMDFNLMQQSSVHLGSPIHVVDYSKEGRPILVKGSLTLDKRSINIEDQAYLYLEEIKGRMGIKNPSDEFRITRTYIGSTGRTHIRMDQYYKGLPIHASDVVLHAKGGVINRFNGTYYPTPDVKVNPTLAQANAIEITKSDLGKTVKIIALNRTGIMAQITPAHKVETTLVIFYPEGAVKAHLAWKVKIHPNITEQWQYIIDAHSGAILDKHINSCKFAHDEAIQKAIKSAGNIKNTKSSPKKIQNTSTSQLNPLDGSLDASGLDLNGFLRSFKTYHVESNNTNYLVDITRDMFQAGSSNMPDEPVGGIMTINGNNGSPQNNNFDASHLTDNNSNWSNEKAVSAHYNAGIAYDYYKNTFGRNSINGSGGTVYSIINISDENGNNMDNAFWNGSAMFYGNGDQAFTPLAGALDVAGHEISHGVIQNTANLAYKGESGALNESFADIFGAMIDRDDWKMGEDIVTSVFPSGALRDLQNPHNGGNSLGDNGYQPDHVNEQYHGSQDNGGVHINSGITNKAYYLFATAIGKDKAEQIYYKALTDYLTMNSQFKNLRIAVLSAAEDLHGEGSNEVLKAGEALDAVGITGPSTGGGGGGGGGGNPGSEYQEDLEQNPGDDFIVFIGSEGKILLADGNGNIFNGFKSEEVTISQPSVTDDGSAIYYVADSKVIRKITFDWGASTFSDQALDISGNSGNVSVAVSPDGHRIVAVEAESNIIYVYDFNKEEWKGFKLTNPTNTGNITTDNVLQADVVYFDYSGNHVMYDALSSIKNNQGEDITFWDIGFIHVWENGTWADGFISKLFSGLPENTSVGNPTFAKNSPYIIAFDYQDKNGTHTLVGTNIETGTSSTIAENDTWSRPSFSPNDKFLLADTKQGLTGTQIVTVPLSSNKIEFKTGGDVGSLISDANWGTWFANGTRSLVLIANEEVSNDGKVTIAPNPFSATLSIAGNDGLFIDKINVYDLQGRLIQSSQKRATRISIDLSNQSAGLYFFKVIDQNGDLRVFKAIKQ